MASAIAIAVVGFACSAAKAVELRPGDILTAGETWFFDGVDSEQYPAILRVDPVTYERVYVSGAGVGSGPEFVALSGIAVRGNSEIFVADGSRILRVDPATGDRAILSGDGVGAGSSLSRAQGLWLRDGSSLLVVDHTAMSVLSVDLATGDRTVISSPTVGTGPALARPYDLTTTLDGRILVASYGATVAEDEYHGFVTAIDPATGNRSILSDATHGGGPGYVSALGITRRANGDILVTDNWPAKVFTIDPATGDQTVFSESVPPATPVPNQFGSPLGIVEGRDGFVYFTDADFGVMRVDPNGGLATRLNGPPGTDFGWTYAITAVQVPEPAGIGLGAVGIGVMALVMWRRARMGQRCEMNPS